MNLSNMEEMSKYFLLFHSQIFKLLLSILLLTLFFVHCGSVNFFFKQHLLLNHISRLKFI